MLIPFNKKQLKIKLHTTSSDKMPMVSKQVGGGHTKAILITL